MPPPEPERPRPPGRRAIFLDVENTSRAQHLAHVIDHLGVNPWDRRTELVAVANWRVVGHEAARLLAARGAHLVHSAPSTGVRDWSDLRIAVAAGIWLASARPGDIIEIVSDDRAFDAVGDVAASLGIEFRRLSYRRLKEDSPETVVVEEESRSLTTSASASGSRRRRRRRGRGPGGPPPSPAGERRHVDSRERDRRAGIPSRRARATRAAGGRQAAGVVRAALMPLGRSPSPPDDRASRRAGLGGARPRRGGAQAQRQHRRGGQRAEVPGVPAVTGLPRLVTRLRRIKELLVSPSGTITLAEDGAPPASEPQVESEPRAGARRRSSRAEGETSRWTKRWPGGRSEAMARRRRGRRRPSAGLPQVAGERARAARDRRQPAAPAPGPGRVPSLALRLVAAGGGVVGAGAGVHASRLRGPSRPDPGRAARRRRRRRLPVRYVPARPARLSHARRA